MTYQELLEEGRQTLKTAGIADAEMDSFLLFEYVIGMDRGQFFLRGRDLAPEEKVMQYRRLAAVRSSHVPLQYITGEQEFMGLPFFVNEKVLVPRQDTECLVELSLPFVRGKRILDMCTGSGCIAVSLQVLGNPSVCHAVDISEEALEVAGWNAERNHAAVTWFQSNLFEKVTQTYDVIISNPPYIPPDIIEGLEEEVRDHEPRIALDGGEDGLEFYRDITKGSKAYLEEGGYLFYEIGCEQAADVMAIMEAEGFSEVVCRKDYAGNDRVVYGHRKNTKTELKYV